MSGGTNVIVRIEPTSNRRKPLVYLDDHLLNAHVLKGQGERVGLEFSDANSAEPVFALTLDEIEQSFSHVRAEMNIGRDPGFVRTILRFRKEGRVLILHTDVNSRDETASDVYLTLARLQVILIEQYGGQVRSHSVQFGGNYLVAFFISIAPSEITLGNAISNWISALRPLFLEAQNSSKFSQPQAVLEAVFEFPSPIL